MLRSLLHRILGSRRQVSRRGNNGTYSRALRAEPLEDRTMLSANILWTNQFGTSSFDSGPCVSTDGLDNVYVSGTTQGDLGGTNAGDCDAFLSKFSSEGTLLWTEQLGTSGFDSCQGVSADGLGNVYITGYTSGDLGGTNAGGDDVFVAKYSDSGTLLWIRQLGTTSIDRSGGVSADGLGNVYISGRTYGNINGTNAGADDAFVAKYNASGTLLWTRQLGTNERDLNTGVSADDLGNVFISGYTFGDLDGTNAGGADAFIAKYSASGTLLWTEQFGTSDDDDCRGVSGDGSGNIYVSGVTEGDLGGANAGSLDVYVSKYDGDGAILWTRQLGTSSTESGNGVSADSLGNVFISGYTYGDLDGANAGGADAFVSEYDANGVLLWTEQFGTGEMEYNIAVSADGSGSVFVSGQTTGNLEGTNAGDADAFVMRIFGGYFVVNTTSDTVDANVGDGIAEDSSGNTSLRAAIQEANAYGEPVRIFVPAGNYELTITGSSEHAAATGDLDITGEVTIIGAGAGLTVIDGGGTAGLNDRLLEVRPGGALDISCVTLTGGDTTSSGNSGAAIRVFDGTLAISDSALVGNHAYGSGGAIYADPVADGVTVIGCVITGNDAQWGGGIQTNMAGFEIGNTILANNTATVAGQDVYKYGSGSFISLGNNLLTDDNGDAAFSGDYEGSVDYVVTSLVDTFDHSDDSYALSLREAVDLANDTAGGETIWLPLWAFVLTLDKGTSSTDMDVSQGDLNIFDTLTVRGINTGTNATSIDWKSGVADEVFRLMGDYLADDVVDVLDYVAWRNSEGQTGMGLPADGDESGEVGEEDYDIWYDGFANTFELVDVGIS